MTEPDMRELCIFGAGGSAHETYYIAQSQFRKVAAFIDLQAGGMYDMTPIKDESFFNPEEHLAVVALGSSKLRRKVAEQIYEKYGDVFVSHVMSPDIILLPSYSVHIGRGAVVAPGCVFTCNINIGKQSQINVATSIMHDAEIGEYFTTAPGVRVNGKCKIGNCVYLGTGALIKDGITICDDVIVGAGAVVVKDITEPGTYVGVPARRIK